MLCRLWSGEQAITHISAFDRGLTYGDGLFETIRIIAGRPVLMDYHWARLSAGCVQLGLVDLPFWRQAWAEFMSQLPSSAHGVVRLQVTRGISGRGYLPDPHAQPTLMLIWYDSVSYPSYCSEQGIEACCLNMPLAKQPHLAGIKHLNRLEQVLLRQELSRHPNCQEGFVTDADGFLIEGAFSNVFLVLAGQLVTPLIHRCGIRGVLREALLDALLQSQIAVLVRDVAMAELWQAEEVFFCNSIYGIWPVLRCGLKTWQCGELTQQCQSMVSPWFI